MLARTQTCDRQFSQISQRAISERCHVIESDDPRDRGKATPSLVTFALRHHVGKVPYLFVQPAMSKNRTILSFDQRIEVMCRLGEAHHVERLLPSQCGKMQMARRPSMLSKHTGKAIVAYVKYKYSRTAGLQYISCSVSLILGLLTIAYIIMTVRVFIRKIDGGDSSMFIAMCIIFGVPRLPIRPCDERPPAMYGHFCLVPRVSVHDRYYCIPLDISLKQRFMKFIQKAFNHTSPLISSIAKLAMCNPWSRSASNYSEIFSDNNGRGTLCPSDIGNKWKANVSVARMNDVHVLREMIEIRDGFKECCILSKEDVSDIIENITVFLTYIRNVLPCAIVYHDVR